MKFQTETLPNLASLTTDAATALRLSDALSDAFAGDAAVAAFEATDGSWTVAIHFDDTLDRDAVGATVRGITPLALRFEHVSARDWVKASLAGLRPVAAGRFVIHGSHDRASIAPNALAIEIEAALAFGTGHHGTTRGCLLAIDALIKSRPRKPLRILDVGTGSGVLAFAAAKALRGALQGRVVASDIDPVAVRSARANAALNHVGGWIETVHAANLAGDVFRRHAPFDLVLANILLPPLVRLATPMRRLLAPGARVILSGLLPDQATAALAAYRARGLVLERRRIVDGWATLTLRRPQTAMRGRPKPCAP